MKPRIIKYLALLMSCLISVALICPTAHADDKTLHAFYLSDPNGNTYETTMLTGYLGKVYDNTVGVIYVAEKNSTLHIIPSDFDGYMYATLSAFVPTNEPGVWADPNVDDWYFTQLLADNQISRGYGSILHEYYPEYQIRSGHSTSFNLGDNLCSNPAFGGKQDMNLNADGTLYILYISVRNYDGDEVIASLFPFVIKDVPEATATATPTNSKILVNGAETSFDAYNIGGNNYFKLRDLAKVLSGTEKQFEVTWDNDAKAINLVSNKAYTAVGGEMSSGDGTSKTAQLSTSPIYLNGELIELTAYNIGGNNYFKLRDLGQAFDFDVSWDNENKTITVDTSKSYTED